jgi:hypothetical protein
LRNQNNFAILEIVKDTEGMPSGGRRVGAGRPPKGHSAFTESYFLRCFHAERAAWERAAKKDGKPLSDWVRETLNKAAK